MREEEVVNVLAPKPATYDKKNNQCVYDIAELVVAAEADGR
jgi:hypothetical protein